jgi:hypothetical protein
MDILRTASALILYIRGNSEYKSSRPWIQWRDTVLSVYENNLQTGTINASINSGKLLFGKSKTAESVLCEVGELNENEKEEICSLLFLYKTIEEYQSSYIPGTFSTSAWDEIISLLKLDAITLERALKNAVKWHKQKKENKFRTEVFVPASIKPVLLDFLLRCFVLFLFQKGLWDYFSDNNWYSDNIFIYFVLQLLVIPVTIFSYAYIRDRKIVAYSHKLVALINISNIRISIQNSAWHYLLVFIMALTGSIIIMMIKRLDWDASSLILTFPAYGLYLLVLQTVFSKTTPNYKSIKQQVQDREHRELSGDLSPEQNDEEIINLEVNLKAENERMNAYVIEAALFGALAFSGFLQIVSAGDFSFEFIADFNRNIVLIIRDFLDSEGDDIRESYRLIFGKNGLIVLLSYQSLFCAVFFLSVIASRLRFSKLTDYIDRFIQLSKAMNEKEEDLLRNDKNNRTDISRYNLKIKEHLREGYKKQDEILPIMEYMQFFRTLGIVMFFVIIITGGMFISSWLSILLFFISGLSLIYFKLHLLRSAVRSFYISMQEFYYRVDKYVHWICWSMIILALILRSFAVSLGSPIMGFGFLFLSLHYLMNLFIPVQFEYVIKKNDAFGSANTFQAILAYLFKVALAIFVLGYLFKAAHWPGAGPMTIISIFIFILYFAFSKKTFAGPVWFEVLLSLSFVTTLLAIMFKQMHWPGAWPLVTIAVPLMIITGIITYFKRKSVLSLIKRTVLILFLLSLSSFSRYVNSAIWNLSFNYTAFERGQRLDYYGKIMGEISNGTLQLNNDSINKIFEEFKQEFIIVENPDYDMLNRFAWDAYQNSNDSIVLNNALLWAARVVELDKSWIYTDTYAALLYKTGHYKEALLYAQEAYEKGKDPETVNLIGKINEVLAADSLAIP